MIQTKDSIYASPLAEIEAFKFDAKVADVFPGMIQRFVPGYQAVIAAIGLLAGRFARPDSVCYGLGCSLGPRPSARKSGFNISISPRSSR